MGRKIRLGMAGCGDIAGFMALVSRLVPAVHLAACCDVDPVRSARFARKHRIPRQFNNFAEMIDEGSLDAVYLAVPHHLHYEMIRMAVEKRLAVLVEKPLTRTLAEARSLMPLIEAAGVKVGVNYQYRYDNACYTLARWMQHGVVGRISSVRINIPWSRQSGYFEQSAWHRTIEQAGGGTLITQGSHFLDIVLWGLGDQPESAQGYSSQFKFQDVEVEDLAHGIVRMQNGALVQIASSMAAATEQAVSIEVYGSIGTAIYGNHPLPHIKLIGAKRITERLPVLGVHALQRSLAGFAAWVLEDTPFLIPASSAVPVLAAVEAIYRSSGSGQREAVEAFA